MDRFEVRVTRSLCLCVYLYVYVFIFMFMCLCLFCRSLFVPLFVFFWLFLLLSHMIYWCRNCWHVRITWVHPLFLVGFILIDLYFMCMLCRSLFVLLCFFFWPLFCLLFFDIRILIPPLVSSNSSYWCSIWVKGMVFNTTFNNISVIHIGGQFYYGGNHWSVTSHWQTVSHIVVSSTPRHERHSKSQFLVVIGTQIILLSCFHSETMSLLR